MKKYIYAALFISTAMLAGCSKSEPEPEPAEQVIGSYAVDKVSQSVKYPSSPEYSLTDTYPLKGTEGGIGYEVTAVLDVAKTASNIVSITFLQTVKLSNGTTEKGDPTAFPGIELKPITGSAGEFDLLETGVKIGTIGKNSIALELASSRKDSTGATYTETYRITGKKPL